MDEVLDFQTWGGVMSGQAKKNWLRSPAIERESLGTGMLPAARRTDWRPTTAAAEGDDQGLAERVGVPGGARTRRSGRAERNAESLPDLAPKCVTKSLISGSSERTS